MAYGSGKLKSLRRQDSLVETWRSASPRATRRSRSGLPHAADGPKEIYKEAAPEKKTPDEFTGPVLWALAPIRNSFTPLVMLWIIGAGHNQVLDCRGATP